jgi:hypothetical protein
MSIRPSVIDRRGEQPCLPANALLAVCERLAEGGTVTLRGSALRLPWPNFAPASADDANTSRQRDRGNGSAHCLGGRAGLNR